MKKNGTEQKNGKTAHRGKTDRYSYGEKRKGVESGSEKRSAKNTVAGKPVGKAGKAKEELTGKITGKPVGNETGKSAGRNAGKPVGRSTGTPVGKPVGKNTGTSVGKPTGKNTGKSAGKTLGVTKDKVIKRKSRCYVSGECGGCKMIDVPYAEQLLLKEKETAKILKPFVKLEGIIGMGQPEHYRNKVNAAFTHDRTGKPLSGVYKEGTHTIIPVEKCYLQNEKADAIIGSIRGLLPSFKIKTYDEDTGYGLLRHVMVRVGHATGQIMVVLVLASPILPSKNNFVKALLKQHPDITTIVVNVNDRKTSMVLGDKEQVIYGKGYIEDILCGITFKLSPKSFYQINSNQTEKLYKKAMEYAGLTGTETVLDAYCGIGTIGLIAADKAEQVIGVELNKDAVKDAIVNAKRNKISNVEFYQKDAGEFMVQLAEQGKHIDTVFMDPPRSGSNEVFLKSLVRLGAKKVVYISCNPETLAADLGYLVKNGYRTVKGVCVDMFPFTNHVETAVLLVRKP